MYGAQDLLVFCRNRTLTNTTHGTIKVSSSRGRSFITCNAAQSSTGNEGWQSERRLTTHEHSTLLRITGRERATQAPSSQNVVTCNRQQQQSLPQATTLSLAPRCMQPAQRSYAMQRQ